MSKNIKLIIEVPVNEIRTSKCGNYINLPESVQINNIEGLSNVEAYIYRSRLVIKKSGATNNKKATTADNNRIDNLEASVGKLAEMMAILVKQNKAKAKA
jgi:hypothetical protein